MARSTTLSNSHFPNRRFFYLLVILVWIPSNCLAYKKRLPLGGVFHDGARDEEIAFRYAIDRNNMYNHQVELKPVVKKVSEMDTFKTGKLVCNMTKEGIAGIIGPQTRISDAIVESTCNNLEIPHLQTFWDPSPRYPNFGVSLNLYPDAETLAVAFAELLEQMDWKSFTIVYEHDDALVRLQEILKNHGPQDPPVTVRQLSEGPDYRQLLKEMQASSESRIVLDCDPNHIMDVLTQAKEVNMMEDYQSYIITSLDTHTIDFGDLRYGRTNITALRLVSPQSSEIRNAVHDWEQGELRFGRRIDITPDTVRTETALTYDAVNIFAKALNDINSADRVNIESVACGANSTAWTHGFRLYSYMKLITMDGLTGPIQFDDQGRRINFMLEIVELSKNGFNKIGTWDQINHINYTRSFGEVYSQIVEGLHNKTFRVVSRLGAPYLMHVENHEQFTGNARFEGYTIDLIDEISKMYGFKYTFELTPDGRYGSYNKETKTWDGLIKQLLDRQADLAICDLTITYDRRTAVDFTMPFMTLGISILYSKPVKEPPDLFKFMSPLSVDVWIYMATAILGVTLFLYMIARLCPGDWENPHPCNPQPEELENNWCVKNCVWLTLGSVMGQGCDILPKGSSTRIATGVWWFFSLIMVASYTANLAAFLTNERMDATITNVEDLAKQSKIKYGAVKGGSTAAFFKDSNFSTYQKMWTVMESTRPSVFPKNNDEGVDRVKKGRRDYAFFMESTSIEYVIERNCDLTQIGGLLDSKGYGIAMPVNSPYRTAISGAVLKLQEEGKLHLLKTKWWKEKHGGGSCQKDDVDDVANELGIDNVGGVFIVLGLGCSAAFGVAILEFLWNVRKVAVDNMISPLEALKCELKFALQVCNSTKPVNTKSESSASSRHSSESEDNRSIAANMLKTAGSFLRLDNVFDKK